MAEPTDPKTLGINSWLEDELYQQYLYDRKTVDESWKKIFESNGVPAISSGNGARATAERLYGLDRQATRYSDLYRKVAAARSPAEQSMGGLGSSC